MIRLILGIYLCSYSLMFWVIHLNMLVIGYNITTYLLYCFTHFETLLIFFGIYFIVQTLHQKS